MNAPVEAQPRRRQLRRAQLSDEVAGHLRAAIMSGTLRPGMFVRLDETAAQLGVSITPVREALLKLSGEGMVQLEPHRGVGRVGIVETGRDQVVMVRLMPIGVAVIGVDILVAHENCPGAGTAVPAERSPAPIANNGFGGSASRVSPAATLDVHVGSSAGARSSTPSGAASSAALRRLVLYELSRRLPETARMRILSSPASRARGLP